MKLYANLHTHSTHSDGGFSPKELARMAKWEGYGALAVTDHDTATGYTELKEECDRLGLETIFGVEFSAPSKLLEGKSQMAGEFHILGYHFDPEYPAMKEYLQGMSYRETEQTRVLFERGVALGHIKGIEWEEVLEYNKGITWLCNEHLFRAMRSKGLITDDKKNWYFNELFGVHRYEVPPAYPFKQESEIIKLIRDAGGIALVAHPHEQLVHMDALIEMGIEGLEIHHHIMTEEERNEGLKIAYERGLYIAGGSDHSGYCSGYFANDENAQKSRFYAPPLSFGTAREHFEELKNRKLNR